MSVSECVIFYCVCDACAATGMFEMLIEFMDKVILKLTLSDLSLMKRLNGILTLNGMSCKLR